MVNQHGWSKYSLATLVNENKGCAFSYSRGCIFTVTFYKALTGKLQRDYNKTLAEIANNGLTSSIRN